jgi:uncharacterized protein with PIN domain
VDAQRWEEARRQVEEELEKAKQRALLAESFDELEDIVVEMGQVIQRTVLVAAVEQREAVGQPRCPECGERMKRKDKVPRQMKSSVGSVRYTRERWICPACGASLFPPGSEDGA